MVPPLWTRSSVKCTCVGLQAPMTPAKQRPVDFRNARPPWPARLPVIDRTSARPVGSSSKKTYRDPLCRGRGREFPHLAHSRLTFDRVTTAAIGGAADQNVALDSG